MTILVLRGKIEKRRGGKSGEKKRKNARKVLRYEMFSVLQQASWHYFTVGDYVVTRTSDREESEEETSEGKKRPLYPDNRGQEGEVFSLDN